jgi:hypothetical protein
MQAVVDRVMRAFTLKHPISDEEAEAIRQEAIEFAADLLEKYKNQLAHRTFSGSWLWIPGSLASLAPRNDDAGVLFSTHPGQHPHGDQ